MAEVITPRELTNDLGVSARTIREWLRAQGWQSQPYTRWHLTADQAKLVRAQLGR